VLHLIISTVRHVFQLVLVEHIFLDLNVKLVDLVVVSVLQPHNVLLAQAHTNSMLVHVYQPVLKELLLAMGYV
jgi:hypothetical protein